jgi:predicted outer membrane repeat protein
MQASLCEIFISSNSSKNGGAKLSTDCSGELGILFVLIEELI